jgi:hypothetical protein
MIFASPDFGAAGTVLCGVAVVYLGIFGIALTGIVCGVKLAKRPTRGGKFMGALLILASDLLPVGCCSAPRVMFRLNHENPPLGHYPNGVIKNGMSMEDVRARLGKEHMVYKRNEEEVTWLYYLDTLELGWFSVTFDANGRVTWTGGN